MMQRFVDGLVVKDFNMFLNCVFLIDYFIEL